VHEGLGNVATQLALADVELLCEESGRSLVGLPLANFLAFGASMSQTAPESFIERLADGAASTPVFGLLGDQISGVIEGLRRCQDRVRCVLVRHEEAAAFMPTRVCGANGASGCVPRNLRRCHPLV
jgi:Thiamine pyrophosphate enzyme, N-terminal TPP binding domain